MLLLTLAMACLVESKPPYLGECAEYPDQSYDYGDLGIGSCLAGPTSLQWADDNTLVVTNANPFLDYTGGSVLSVDVDAVLEEAAKHVDRRVSIVPDVHVTSDLAIQTVLDDGSLTRASLPGYSILVPGGPGADSMLLVPNRLSPEARGRQGFDRVHIVGVEAGGALSPLTVGPDSSDTLTLMSDPTVSAYDPVGEQVFIGNLTSHTVSVLDVSNGAVSLIDGQPRATLSRPVITDTDGSGSQVELSSLEILTPEEVDNQTWTLEYVDGNNRAWLPGLEGLSRWDSPGASLWQQSTVGPQIQVGDGEEGFVYLADPSYGESALGSIQQAMVIDGGVYIAVPNGQTADQWGILGNIALGGREGSWDETLGGPMLLVSNGIDYLFFDGANTETGESGINLAASADGQVFSREQPDALILAGTNGEHDSVRVADPFVVFDAQADRWRMYYSAWDGVTWSIGHAESTDLVDWVVDTQAIFQVDGGAAAPVVQVDGSGWKMWTSRASDDGWVLALATSADGSDWFDQGEVLALEDGPDPLEPPGISMQRTNTQAWSPAGDVDGRLGLLFESGDLGGFGGLVLQLSSGFELGTVSLEQSELGIRVDSILDDGKLMVTLTDGSGAQRIGQWRAGQTPVADFFAAADSEIATQGVHTPVAFDGSSGLEMLYAGVDQDNLARIGRASSSDGGVTWQDEGLALDLGEDWDSVRVVPGAVVGDSAELTLYYTGFNGTQSRIGTAVSTDQGQSWTRVEGQSSPWTYGGGIPGAFDDSAVRTPSVLRIDGVDHIWYGAFDGDVWRMGYASRSVGTQEWVQSEGRDGSPKWAMTPVNGTYLSTSMDRAVLRQTEDGFEGYVSGWDSPEGIRRAGPVVATQPDTLYPEFHTPTLGDTITLFTQRGDDGDSMAIDLEVSSGGASFSGIANSFMHVDNVRGFLFIGSELQNAIYVVDIRDDSTEDFVDSNVYGIEAVLVNNADSGASSTRGIIAPPGERWVYALNAQPDAMLVYDGDAIPDDSKMDLYFDTPVGAIAMPRGMLADEGVTSQRDVGPAQVVAAGDLLVVANFNDNSLSFVDTRLGAYGQVTSDLDWVGENPHALSLSPDGTLLAVGNYIGELVDGHVNSSVVLVDMDPTSETYLSVLATLVNQ